ncbi:hypothetical protein QLL94_gp29 [Pectobacterium phage PP2]|uniref:Uncharacterized protein n=1 Tax=Pectobacterium phage PP2 TaxID=1897743 RepID=A0A1W5P506_9CAUD|nr:hypothetical protein QLL94_gp29 [Pectobacterium phage PP2]AOT25395.1 hypothetical protein PP2_029 [Pectobacterium phage PP2]
MSKEQDVKVLHRLSPEAYRQLEQKLPQPATPADGTQAAYNLGIQYVLKVLRDGFVA